MKSNVKELFKGYIKYTDEEYKKIWKDGLIVVDTNILLDFYRYSDETKDKMFSIFKELQNRLWIPYQVGKEYFNNRNNVIISSYKKYDKLNEIISKDLNNSINEISKNKDKQMKCKKIIIEKLKNVEHEIQILLENEKKEKKTIIENNIIESKLLDIFGNLIGENFSEEEYSNVKTEGKKRIENQIPPGYKDDKKNSDENGDYNIFYSIIKKSKEVNKDIIFITGDEKEDWYIKIDGEKLGARYELLDEFYKKTGKLLLLYSFDGFTQQYLKNNKKSQFDDNVIKELQSINQSKYDYIYENFEDQQKYFKNLDASLDDNIIETYKYVENASLPINERNKLLYKLRLINEDDNQFRKREKLNTYLYHLPTLKENKNIFNQYNFLLKKLNRAYLNFKNNDEISSQHFLIEKLLDIIKELSFVISKIPDSEQELIQPILEKILSISKNRGYIYLYKNKKEVIELLDELFTYV